LRACGQDCLEFGARGLLGMQCRIRHHDAFTESTGTSKIDHGARDGGYRNREAPRQIACWQFRLMQPDACPRRATADAAVEYAPRRTATSLPCRISLRSRVSVNPSSCN
jgi:hypothetical protein